jgi:DNA invertase Pin-like site-specific DNA recombinase
VKESLAYIRRSFARTSDLGDTSREFQTEAVRRLAADATLRIIDQDWGRSASTDKIGRRIAFLDLMEQIERGEVDTLYAYSVDRLARSVEWSARLLNACRRAGTTIVTSEGRFAPGDEGAAIVFHMYSAMNESALSGMERKARSTMERRRARNIEAGLPPNANMGRKPYGTDPTHPDESVEAVLAAFDATGSFLGAAKNLTAAGIPTRLRAPWSVTTVARIIRRHRPDMPRTGRAGARARATRALSGLLVCPCGQIMSSMPRPGGRSVGYYCARAHTDRNHPRPYVISEAKLMPAIQAEAAHLVIPGDSVELEAPSGTEEGDLHGRLDRANDLFIAGEISRERRDREVAGVTETLARLQYAADLRRTHEIDWNWDGAELNRHLSVIWSEIRLDANLHPLPFPGGFQWHLPEWRAD